MELTNKLLTQIHTIMNELTLIQQKEVLTNEFGGKNLTINIKKGASLLVSNFTIIDRSNTDLKEVFDSFSKIIIGVLSKVLIVNKSVGIDQQSEPLTFEIQRDCETVYSFVASYKDFKKYFTSVLMAEALGTLSAKGIWENAAFATEIVNNTNGYDTLMLLQRIALAATYISPVNEPLVIGLVEQENESN